MSTGPSGGSSAKWFGFWLGAGVVAFIVAAVVAFGYWRGGTLFLSAPSTTVERTVPVAPTEPTSEELAANIARDKAELDSRERRTDVAQLQAYAQFGASPIGADTGPAAVPAPSANAVAPQAPPVQTAAVPAAPPPPPLEEKRVPPEPGIAVKMPGDAPRCYAQVRFKKADEERMSTKAREELVVRVLEKFCSETGSLVQTSGTIAISDSDTREVPWQARPY